MFWKVQGKQRRVAVSCCRTAVKSDGKRKKMRKALTKTPVLSPKSVLASLDLAD